MLMSLGSSRTTQSGDKPIRVWINAAVVFGADEQRLLLHLYKRQVATNEYVAPQRIGDWGVINGLFKGQLLVKAEVDEYGDATTVDVVEGDDAPRTKHRAAERIASQMKTECFVPGRVNGQPTAMTYLEVFDGIDRPESTWN